MRAFPRLSTPEKSSSFGRREVEESAISRSPKSRLFKMCQRLEESGSCAPFPGSQPPRRAPLLGAAKISRSPKCRRRVDRVAIDQTPAPRVFKLCARLRKRQSKRAFSTHFKTACASIGSLGGSGSRISEAVLKCVETSLLKCFQIEGSKSPRSRNR